MYFYGSFKVVEPNADSYEISRAGTLHEIKVFEPNMDKISFRELKYLYFTIESASASFEISCTYGTPNLAIHGAS